MLASTTGPLWPSCPFHNSNSHYQQHACSRLNSLESQPRRFNNWISRNVVAQAGLPFSLQKPKYLKFKWARQYPTYTAGELQVEVDTLLEGQPSAVIGKQLEALLEQLEEDCKQAVPLVLQAKQQTQPKYKLPAIANVSLVLSDDAHIQELNKQYRNKDLPTDVLSFEIPDEAPSVYLPIKLLGDLVISVDTASRQAVERR